MEYRAEGRASLRVYQGRRRPNRAPGGWKARVPEPFGPSEALRSAGPVSTVGVTPCGPVLCSTQPTQAVRNGRPRLPVALPTVQPIPTAAVTQLRLTTNAPVKTDQISFHVDHIRKHSKRVDAGQIAVPDPGAVYMGHREGDRFWEVIGFRLKGHPAAILGAAPFQEHDLPGVENSRESLSSYLSHSQGARRAGPTGGPSGWIPVLLPRIREPIPSFLSQLRAGNVPRPVLIDPSTIEFAFDFRFVNPFSMAKLRKPLLRHLIRTERGHLVSGYCHDPQEGRVGADDFISVKDPIQHTAKGSRRLIPLAIRKSFINLMVDISDEETRMAAAHWVPFNPATATSEHLLTQ